MQKVRQKPTPASISKFQFHRNMIRLFIIDDHPGVAGVFAGAGGAHQLRNEPGALQRKKDQHPATKFPDAAAGSCDVNV